MSAKPKLLIDKMTSISLPARNNLLGLLTTLLEIEIPAEAHASVEPEQLQAPRKRRRAPGQLLTVLGFAAALLAYIAINSIAPVLWTPGGTVIP